MHSRFSCRGENSSLSQVTRFAFQLVPSVTKLVPALILVALAMVGSALAQQAVLTSHNDNLRTGQNTTETLLAPSNVNKATFGRLFSVPVDYQVIAQPLYVPNVSIAGGIHNVLYVATLADSVYAIDADTGAQLWWVNFTNTAQGYPAGLTTASGKYLPCGTLPGYSQEGIVGTPVIDSRSNTIYVVGKTLQNGTVVRHDLHALDLSTGAEKFGGPVQIAATSTSLKGKVTQFNSLHQKNRPGLVLVNGVLYMAFGSNGCNDNNTGWVLSYNPTSLQQLGSFNTSPDIGLTSIWQSGAAPAADSNGYIYAETAESTNYDVPLGGQSYCNSVLKLSPTSVALSDYFTPWNVAFLNTNDYDLSSSGVLLLPDQPGPYPHEAIATGKFGAVYVLNRDNMGMFSTNDTQIIQELSLIVVGEMMGSPAYWNGTVYFNPTASPLQSFKLSNGQLVPSVNTSQKLTGSHSPSVSSNGNTNGIVWLISGNQLWAFDAVSLKLLYTSGQSGARDTLPPVPHFVTQTVANGRVYVGTKASVEAYGLFHALAVTGGANQSGTVATNLPIPVKITAHDPYSGQPDPGVTVSFSDGGKGGTFTPSSGVTDSNGNVSTVYKLPTKANTYTLTASAATFGTATTTATALPGAAIKIISYGGAKQSATVGTTLLNPIVAQARDSYNNGVPGVAVSFSVTAGTLTPTSGVTDAKGLVSTSYQVPTKSGTYSVKASSAGLKTISFPEYAVAGPATSIAVTGGNNQSAPAGSTLPVALTVVVRDQYNNPVPNMEVTFTDSSAGGTFGNPNPALTSSTGVATQTYTLPAKAGTYTVSAAVSGVANPANFTETAQ
jgi:hypothetical protein